MTANAKWQCPNCGEEHDKRFDTCWKCGTDSAGDRDPEFQVSEPVGEPDQAPDSPTDQTQLPDLQLPTVTYFSIPPTIWICLAVMPRDLQRFAAHRMLEFSPSPGEIVVQAIVAVLVGIPIFLTMVRAWFLCIIRRYNASNGLAELLWILSMFQLPESFRRRHGWFVPVYYGSLGALFIAALGFVGWCLIDML